MTKKQQKTKQSQYYVPVALQWVMVLLIIPFYAITLIVSAWSTIGQLGQGFDMGSQFVYLYSQQLVPALLFVLAYVINPRGLGYLARSFESLLIAVVASMGWMLVGGIFFTVFFAAADQMHIMQLELYSYVSYTIFLALFVVFLLSLRLSGRWR